MPLQGYEEEDDLYAQLKTLQRQEEFLDIQEEYIKDEMRNLKRELIRAREVRSWVARWSCACARCA